jgi:hypothetical protein
MSFQVLGNICRWRKMLTFRMVKDEAFEICPGLTSRNSADFQFGCRRFKSWQVQELSWQVFPRSSSVFHPNSNTIICFVPLDLYCIFIVSLHSTANIFCCYWTAFEKLLIIVIIIIIIINTTTTVFSIIIISCSSSKNSNRYKPCRLVRLYDFSFCPLSLVDLRFFWRFNCTHTHWLGNACMGLS